MKTHWKLVAINKVSIEFNFAQLKIGIEWIQFLDELWLDFLWIHTEISF